MNYDRLGFPIPPQFDLPPQADAKNPIITGPGPRRQAGRRKRLLVIAILLGAVVPAAIVPAILPAVREGVVRWSLEQAIRHEGRGALAEAIADLGRAMRWGGRAVDADPERKSRLLCWRAMLRMENRDLTAAVADADLAASIAPMNAQPHRIRALSAVIRGDADAALAAAQVAFDLDGPNHPEALNHRAYIRALVGRDLEPALTDVEAALRGSGDASPEYLDTRGFVLHLLGRQQEAIDDLNRAIDAAQTERRRLATLLGHVDHDELAYRLRSADHGLAVMHHHRGLACRALGLAAQAEQDFEVAKKKGFDPDRGIF